MLCCWRRGRAAARSAAAGSGAGAGHLGHAAPRPSRHPRAVAGRDRPLRPEAQGRRAPRLHRVQRRDHDAAGAGGGRERGGVRQHAQRYALRLPLTSTVPFTETTRPLSPACIFVNLVELCAVSPCRNCAWSNGSDDAFAPRAAALIPTCGLEYGKTPTAEDYPRMCGIAACFSALSGFVADCPRHGGTPIARSALATC